MLMDFKWDDQVDYFHQEFPLYAKCDDGIVHLVVHPTSAEIVSLCGFLTDGILRPEDEKMCVLCLNMMDRIAVERGRDTIITLGREDQVC